MAPEPRRQQAQRERQREQHRRERQERVCNGGSPAVRLRADRRDLLSRRNDGDVIEVTATEHALVCRDERVPPGFQRADGLQHGGRRCFRGCGQRNSPPAIEVVQLIRRRIVHVGGAHEQRPNVRRMHAQRICRVRRLRVAPGKQLHRSARRGQELPRHLAREVRLVRVANSARPDSRDCRHERQRHEDEQDRAGGNSDACPVRPGA